VKHCNALRDIEAEESDLGAPRTAQGTHCNKLQNTEKHCNTLQYTVTHCNTLRHMEAEESYVGVLQEQLKE